MCPTVWQDALYSSDSIQKAPLMPAFPDIKKPIAFEGAKSKNPLAFRHYDEKEVVEGRCMKEHFRFSVAYWHTFRGTGSDPFGSATMVRPWDDGSDSVENAQRRARVAFEFIEKVGPRSMRSTTETWLPRGRRSPRATRTSTRW